MEYFKKNGVILGPAIAANAGLLLSVIHILVQSEDLHCTFERAPNQIAKVRCEQGKCPETMAS